MNKVLLLTFCLQTVLALQAQTNERHIEVTGISENRNRARKDSLSY